MAEFLILINLDPGKQWRYVIEPEPTKLSVMEMLHRIAEVIIAYHEKYGRWVSRMGYAWDIFTADVFFVTRNERVVVYRVNVYKITW